MSKLNAPLAAIAAALFLSGCGLLQSPHDPSRQGQYVTVVNSLEWNNPLSGKRDAVRTAWPAGALNHHREWFPLAQLKQCDAAGVCAWGVLNANRTLSARDYQPGAIVLKLEVQADIARQQEVHRAGYDALLRIPSDVPALEARKATSEELTMAYGKLHVVDLGHGVNLRVCAARHQADGKALDQCAINYN